MDSNGILKNTMLSLLALTHQFTPPSILSRFLDRDPAQGQE
ncbi:uncharacterized protein METZ01_LOCUS256064, partial [marine metagenome]